MKTYKDTEFKNWSWLKRQEYIPSSDSLGDGSTAGWKLIEKFPMEKIIYDPKNYVNVMNLKQVIKLTNKFYPFGFHPIRINKNYRLLDGQHRLKFAQICGLKYIDVWIDK